MKIDKNDMPEYSKPKKIVCEWFMCGIIETSCGKSVVYVDEHDKYKYCPYCGKKIIKN